MFVLREEVLICSSRKRDGATSATDVTGHNWRVVASVERSSLDNEGRILTEGLLAELLWSAVEPLDHRHLDDLEPFAAPPGATPPKVAQYVYEQLAAMLEASGVRLSEVSVWTSRTHQTTYRPPSC